MSDNQPASSSNPSVTESQGKLCSACSERKSKASFSNKQWLEPAASRRCTSCIGANATAPAKSASPSPVTAASISPAPTTTASAAALKAKKAAAAAPVMRPTAVRDNSVLSNKPHSARPPPKKNPKRPVLLDDDGDWFLPAAEAALSAIFDRFDDDGDGQWSIRETQQFAIATNGKPFTTEFAHTPRSAAQTQGSAEQPADRVLLCAMHRELYEVRRAERMGGAGGRCRVVSERCPTYSALSLPSALLC